MKLFDYLRNKRLARIARKSKNEIALWKAVQKITDEAVLKEVALNASTHFVLRLAAVQKITDAAVLKEAALKDADRSVREEAVEKITDMAVLKEVALNDSDMYVRRTAKKRIDCLQQET
ncbi:MAG: hypothetical protein LBP50_06780 [Tannerella sp.]|jgi:hypothetical protein|nr:hypothetical protein [Tannerella sp.]